MLTEHDLHDLLAHLNCGSEPIVGDTDLHGRAFELYSGSRGPTTAEDLAKGLAELGLEQEQGLEEDADYLAELASDLTSGGAVLAIDSQGFRSVDVYTSAEELAEAWTDAESYVAEREQEAEAELEREIRSAVDADMPERWTIVHHAWTGCNACPRAFETREEAEEAFTSALNILRTDGYTIERDEPVSYGSESYTVLRIAEVSDPEEACMQSDEAGTLEIRWNGPAREAEVEKRLERLY